MQIFRLFGNGGLGLKNSSAYSNGPMSSFAGRMHLNK